MKRLLQILAVLLAFALSSCSEDTSNYGWLNWTIWEADLAGRDVEGMGTLSEGLLRFQFKKSGFEFGSKLSTSNSIWGGSQSRILSEEAVEYDYPTIRIKFDFNYEEASDPNLILYNVGTFTEDNKNLHFDSFALSQDVMFKDVTFVRKW